MPDFREFYNYPKYAANDSDYPLKTLFLLQVDIAGHSKMSNKDPEKVMELKIKLANKIQNSLTHLGFKGVFWAGDGGMYSIEFDSTGSVASLIDAWRGILFVLKDLNKQYNSFCGDIQLRVSAHLANIRVHESPSFWHSTELNFFAKHERDIGNVNVFRITSAVYNELSNGHRDLFKPVDVQIDDDPNHKVYECIETEKTDVSDTSNQMRQIVPVVDEIIDKSNVYRTTVEQLSPLQKDGKGDILFVVNVQRDFCDSPKDHSGHLFVNETEKMISTLNELIKKAEQNGIPIIFTRDWHPDNHNSFVDNGGIWTKHCVSGGDGAEFDKRLLKPTNSYVVDIGSDNKKRDYSPFCDNKLLSILKDLKPKRILVSGIALEYCVLATCLDSKAHVEDVVLLENYVRAANDQSSEIQTVWRALEDAGVERIKDEVSFSV